MSRGFQPDPRLSSTPIAGKPCNPAMSIYARHPGTRHTDLAVERNREAGNGSYSVGEL